MSDRATGSPASLTTRERIIARAAELLREQGPGAVTTRNVAQAAGVQAPAIYRLFGDKDGLLEAIAEHVLTTYVAEKVAVATTESTDAGDPVEDLRAGWQTHIDFALANPALFTLLNTPGRHQESAAGRMGASVLRARVGRIAAAGRLAVDEQRAVDLIRAAGIGAVSVMLATPSGTPDLGLADSMFDAVIRVIVTDAPTLDRDPLLVVAATTVRAHQPSPSLSAAEASLLQEWLDRIINGAPSQSTGDRSGGRVSRTGQAPAGSAAGTGAATRADEPRPRPVDA